MSNGGFSKTIHEKIIFRWAFVKVTRPKFNTMKRFALAREKTEKTTTIK